MSGVGRGKGRGFAEFRDTALRRPGVQSTSKFSELINLIDAFTLNETVSEIKINDIVQKINDAQKTNSLREVFDDLHKQALDDGLFCHKLAMACCDAKVYSINEFELRMIMFRSLQTDYEERNDLIKKDVVQFRNAVSFLGEVYNRYVCKDLQLDFLAPPLLDYLEMLLDASEEEDVELVASQISKNGLKIHEKSLAKDDAWDLRTKLGSVIMRVRLVLINRNLSAKSRALLVFIIDLANQNFVPLSGKLHNFYFNEMGIDIPVAVKSLSKNLTLNLKQENNFAEKNNEQFLPRPSPPKARPNQPNVDNTVKTPKQERSYNFRNNERSPPNVDNTVKTPKQEKSFNFGTNEKSPPNVDNTVKTPKQEKSFNFGTNERSPPNANNQRVPVPRAIRGAGASDSTKDRNAKKSPRGKKDKISDDKIWGAKQNTSSKVWGHDDRFDKDYD